MNKTKRKMFIVAGVVFSVTAGFGFPVSNGPIVPGEWNSSFSRGMAYANEYKVPMLVFWSSVGCGNCGNMRRSCNLDDFVEWQTQRQIVMIFDETPGSSAKSFAKNPSGKFPYMAVYWPKEDGTATTNRFSGLAASMPAPQRDENGNVRSLAMQLAASVDMFIEGYSSGDFAGGSFVADEYEGNRLEAVAGETKWVDVPLARSLVQATKAAEADFVAILPDGSAVTNRISWNVGERSKKVRMAVPESAPVDGEIVLQLLDDDGKARDESLIAIVPDPGNSVRNPDWLADEFAFGRWTLDYDAATNAVAQKTAASESAYTLAMFSGVLWCPYCNGMENSLLASDKFYDWAAKNNVALVLFDQGRASSPATAEGTQSPRLLTSVPDPRLDATNTVSGAGYLSRKMVEEADAEAVIARTTELTALWRAPGATAARLGNPTLLLIKDGAVVGRCTTWRDADRVYDPDENIGRLDDLLKLAARDGEQDDYRTTTTRVHAVGDTSEASFQISDRNEYFAVQGLAAGRFNVVRTDGEEGRDIVFSLLQGAKALASGTNSLAATLSAETVAGGDFKLQVSAYANSTERFFNPESGDPAETTTFSASFSSEFVMVPEERSTSFTPAGDSVKMVVEEGKDYMLTGFASESLAASFTVKDAEHSIYTATAGGELTLGCDPGAEEVSCQLWKPGSVGFATARMVETEGEKKVQLALVRTDGSSGAFSAKVSLADAAGVPAERYGWEDQTVEWGDGDTADKAVTLTLHDDTVFDGDQTLAFAVAVTDGYGVGTGTANLSFTIKENDTKTKGRLAITGTDPGLSGKMTIVAGEGSDVAITVTRLVGAESPVEGIISATAGRFADSETTEQTFNWADRDRTAARTAVLTLPALSECPSGKVTVKLSGQGISADSAARTLTIRIIAADAPAFGVTDATLTNLVRYVAFERVVPIDLDTLEKDSGAVKVTRISGTQPPGVKFDWNSATGEFFLSGTPTKAGTYSASYQISQIRDGKTVAGGTVRVTFPIADIGTGAGSVNPAVAANRTFKDVPVVARTAKRLAGILTLTVPPSGRLSGKYTCNGGVKSLSCAAWSGCADDGTLTAELYTRDGEYSVAATVSADGTVQAEVWDPDFPGDTLSATVGETEAWSKSNTAEDWRGVYTVAHIPVELASGSDRIAATGAAVLSMKMTSATAFRSGTMTYAGFLPNGTAISGSATLQRTDGGDVCLLPVFKRSTTDRFASLLAVAAGAAEAYDEAGTEDPTVQRAIVSSAAAEPVWANASRKAPGYADFEVRYAAYGSYYVQGQDFEAALMNTEVLPETAFSVRTAELTDSDVYGALGEIATATVKTSGGNVTGNGVSLSLNKATGVVSGTFSLPFAERSVTATYKAVLLPGWTGCGCTDEEDLPFFAGACWFSDTFLYQEDWETCSESTAPYIRVPFKRGCLVTAETTAYGD